MRLFQVFIRLITIGERPASLGEVLSGSQIK
jgi:hypothetical protein